MLVDGQGGVIVAKVLLMVLIEVIYRLQMLMLIRTNYSVSTTFALPRFIACSLVSIIFVSLFS